MGRISFAMLAAAALLLGGCAGTAYKPIQLDNSFYQDRQSVIGVASEKVPEATAHMLGAQGLLDVAINQGNAAKMMERLKTLEVKRAAVIPDNLADGLTRRGLKVNKLETLDPATFPEFKPAANPEQYAPRDFRGLKAKGIDRLLHVSIRRLGTTRNYTGFIPAGPPRAVFAVTGQLVDVSTNKLLWYNAYELTAAIPEPWDQEPGYSNVSDTVMKNMLDGASQFERSLFATGN